MSYKFDPKEEYQQGVELHESVKLDPRNDEIALGIAKYLADGLNYSLWRRSKERAVMNILGYDGKVIDNTQFPLLKVYRTTDNFAQDENLRISKMEITYSLNFPDHDKLPGLINWLSVSLNKLLDFYHYEHDNFSAHNVLLGDREGQYRILLNEINRRTYPFFRMPFELVEQNIC